MAQTDMKDLACVAKRQGHVWSYRNTRTDAIKFWERTYVCTRITIISGAVDPVVAARIAQLRQRFRYDPAGEIFLGGVFLVLAAVVFFCAWFLGAYCLMIRLTAHSGRADVSLKEIEAELGEGLRSTSDRKAEPFQSFHGTIADEEQERKVDVHLKRSFRRSAP